MHTVAHGPKRGKDQEDDVKRARYELPTVRDSNLALVHREINRLMHRIGVPGRVRDDID